MAKKLIVANWKMNPETPREAKEILTPVKKIAQNLKRVTTVLCPPALFLPLAVGAKPSEKVAVGGQDCFGEISGAYTGKISPTQLYYAGARYLILGHSESRAAGDTDAAINHKLRLALKAGLKVILCIGEHQRDEAGQYLQFIKQQLEEDLKNVQRKFANQLIVAYEPVWAIGIAASGPDNPESFHHQSIYIRKIVASFLGKEAAMDLPILYGGSVTSKTAEAFLKAGEADGLLVGRASLDPAEFGKILKIAEAVK